MQAKKKEIGLIPQKSFEKLNPSSKLKKLNDIEFIDSFEIMDIEEKLDFSTEPINQEDCICNNFICY